MKYWENPEVFEERNKQIAKDKEKMTVLELSIKYNLSSSRVLSIVKREKLKNLMKGVKNGR